MNTKDCYGLWESFHQIIVQNYIKQIRQVEMAKVKRKKGVMPYKLNTSIKKSSLQKLKWLYHLKQTGPISKPKA